MGPGVIVVNECNRGEDIPYFFLDCLLPELCPSPLINLQCMSDALWKLQTEFVQHGPILCLNFLENLFKLLKYKWNPPAESVINLRG